MNQLKIVGAVLFPTVLLICSLGGRCVPVRAPAADGRPVGSLADAPISPLDASQSPAMAFIQEPVRRSALRPDFSGSLRHSNHRGNFFMLQAFKEATELQWQCTVQLVADGYQCALGTVVDADGWIITKASELDQECQAVCILSDGRQFTPEVVSTTTDLDLALLRIPAEGLPTVEWDLSVPTQGKWLATTDARSSTPVAIGVVSAGPTAVRNEKAVLGVELASDPPGERQGALIKHVLVGSGAHQAGLQRDDSIRSVNGNQIGNRQELLDLLRNGHGGQFLTLTVHREESEFDTRVRLMDLTMEMLDETEMEVNGPISARATGFTRILMHDTVIQPNQCGGPLVNLDGKAVGINIARAGRVSTYALPAETVRSVVQSMLHQAKLVSHARATAPTADASSAAALPLATAP